ncbi:MAG: hypothetical protein ACYCYO_09115 [Bacilli bacterium]
MSRIGWSEENIDVSLLLLDTQNPRINSNPQSSQEELKLRLLKNERVVELAHKISAGGGLLPGERIITCIENGQYIVLEGNRRVCACQLLIDPKLLPIEYKRKFPVATNEELLENIKVIPIEVAPDREAAEPVITIRHTEPGIIRWSTTANMRRVGRWFDEGRSLEEIVLKSGMSGSTVRKRLREYYLVGYILNLSGWSAEELDILTDERLNTNPLTRFFELRNAKSLFPLAFDNDFRSISKLSTADFDDMLRFIARSFLIPSPNSGKPLANTRTTPEELYSLYSSTHGSFAQTEATGTENRANQQSIGEEDSSVPQGKYNEVKSVHDDSVANSDDSETLQKEGNPPKSNPPKLPKFFEQNECGVEDERLIRVVREIKSINYRAMPISATFLVRALLESTLEYQLRLKGKWTELVDMQNNRKSPGLSDMIYYCLKKENSVFDQDRMRSVLQNFVDRGFKEQLDLVIHGKWTQQDPHSLEQISAAIRAFITEIIA